MRRDRMTLGLIFMLPLVQLLLFGYAIQTEVKHIPTVVFDQSLSVESRDLLDAFGASGYFDVTRTVNSYTEVNKMIDSGEAKGGCNLSAGFCPQHQTGRARSGAGDCGR